MKEGQKTGSCNGFKVWQSMERNARLRDCDALQESRSKGTITFHHEGSLIVVKSGSGWEPHEQERGSKRKAISGFSSASRLRLLRLCASIREDALPLFITLTYPREWPADPALWKRHLDTFTKWLRRRCPETSGIWKLEPQKRGAPHFHLMVWEAGYVPHQTVAQRWYEIVGSNDPRHLYAGTRVEAIRSRNGVMLYASKQYMGKEIEGFTGVGRFWGIFNRRSLPISATMAFEVRESALVHVRRVFRRLMQSRGKRVRGNRSFSLFSKAHLCWSRVIDWAESLGGKHALFSSGFRLKRGTLSSK